MKRIFFQFLLIVFAVSWLTHPGAAQQLTNFEVVTIERKPFSYKQNNVWTGFSIELWERVSRSFNASTSYVEAQSFTEMLENVEMADSDLAAANISITAAREGVMDFSQPIFDSGLAIMTQKGNSSSVFAAVLNVKLLQLLLAAIALFIAAGACIAFFERKNPHFDNLRRPKSLEEGIWWAVSVVTNASFTIFTPLSMAGRFLAYILIIIGLFVVSAFVAQITATLTVQELRSQVDGVNDLRSKKVGTTEASTSSRYLTRQAIDHETFTNLEELYIALKDGNIDAVVHDAPILAYYVKNEASEMFETNGGVFNPEKYGFALPQDSKLREQINRELLLMRENGEFDALVRKWFGSNYQ